MASLPIIDLAPLASKARSPTELQALSDQLSHVFENTGFAYLMNPPLTSSYENVFTMAQAFFALPLEDKMATAKTAVRKGNQNTYRGYFPVQPGSDNQKEGFDIGPPAPLPRTTPPISNINLTECNVWPTSTAFTSRQSIETLYAELQTLSTTILSLLAIALGKPADHFAHYLTSSISTLRLLHYPSPSSNGDSKEGLHPLVCTPHTDSGLFTLLHQDPIGGLEVLSCDGKWIHAPYVPGSLVVNVGDLMSLVSGGRFKATQHRVRSNGKERFSVPFFFEPGVDCVVGDVTREGRDGEGEGVVYGRHVLKKMEGWVEFRDEDGRESG